MKNFYFILKSLGIGLVIYSITGFLLACVLVQFFNSDHPHVMVGLLYLFIPGAGAIFGLSLGLILSLFNMKKYSISRITKQLIIGVPFSIIIFFVVTEFFLS